MDDAAEKASISCGPRFGQEGMLSIIRQEPQIPEPDYDDPREIYGFFGLTFYMANVLEHGVMNLAVALLSKDVSGITAGDVDRLYESFDKKTFGQVIKVAQARFDFSESFAAELELALDHRNYLAHRFFIVHDIDILTESGWHKMIDELIEILKHLKKIDREMDKIWMSAWEHLGITKEWIEDQVQNYMAQRRESDA